MSAEVPLVLFLFLLISLVWLWAGLHMAYKDLWMLVLYVIFNCLLVSPTTRSSSPSLPRAFRAATSRVALHLWYSDKVTPYISSSASLSVHLSATVMSKASLGGFSLRGPLMHHFDLLQATGEASHCCPGAATP